MLNTLLLSLMTLVLMPLGGEIAQMNDKKPEKLPPIYTTDHEEMMAIISKRARELKQNDRFDSTDPLPPWEVIFDIPMTHMAWRMGSGEDYRQKFYRFFIDLNQHNRENYMLDYPEPEGWNGYYQMLIDRSAESGSEE